MFVLSEARRLQFRSDKPRPALIAQNAVDRSAERVKRYRPIAPKLNAPIDDIHAIELDVARPRHLARRDKAAAADGRCVLAPRLWLKLLRSAVLADELVSLIMRYRSLVLARLAEGQQMLRQPAR